MSPREPEVFIELHPSAGGCYVNARIEGTSDRIPHAFLGVFGSRDEAAAEAAGWALGWLRILRVARRHTGPV
jgi:DNA gyrase inhibitor GyrI